MIGRRTAVGLSLLCALLFSAIAVQSASAAKAVNTAAYECVKQANGGFSDPHCDNFLGKGKGEYGHVAITAGKKTAITVDNETTGGVKENATLEGKLFGASIEITCNTIHGEGWIENKQNAEKTEHSLTGTLSTKFSSCTVGKPSKCTVHEPIEVKTEFEGVERLGASEETMGVELKPDGGGSIFAVIKFTNKEAEKCSLHNLTGNLEGTLIATGKPNPKERHSGATAISSDEMSTETLKFGGGKASLKATTTVRVKGGSPIALTTPTENNSTTAVTCVKEGGNLDFKDAHCDERVAFGTGEYGHVAINTDEETQIEVTNKETANATTEAAPAVFKFIFFGASVEFSCSTVEGQGRIENKFDSETQKHTVEGTLASEFSNCTVSKPSGCVVPEPIEIKAEFKGIEVPGPNKETMGLEFVPDNIGGAFFNLTFKNKGAEKCGLHEKTFPIEGTMISTGKPNPKEQWSGATAIFTDEMTTETLRFGGSSFGFEATTTVKSEGGNPISLTTPT